MAIINNRYFVEQYELEKIIEGSTHAAEVVGKYRETSRLDQRVLDAMVSALLDRKDVKCDLFIKKGCLNSFFIYRIGDGLILKVEDITFFANDPLKADIQNLFKRIYKIAKREEKRIVEISISALDEVAKTILVAESFYCDSDESTECSHLTYRRELGEKKSKRALEPDTSEIERKVKRARTNDYKGDDRRVRRQSSELTSNRSDKFAPKGSMSTLVRMNSQPRQHRVTLMAKYLNQIKFHGKTIEGRINSGFVLKLRAGDNLQFFNNRDPRGVNCEIIAIRTYKSFREMLAAEGVSNCLTDVDDLEKGVEVYDRIRGYNERAAKSGVVAIQIKPII